MLKRSSLDKEGATFVLSPVRESNGGMCYDEQTSRESRHLDLR